MHISRSSRTWSTTKKKISPSTYPSRSTKQNGSGSWVRTESFLNKRLFTIKQQRQNSPKPKYWNLNPTKRPIKSWSSWSNYNKSSRTQPPCPSHPSSFTSWHRTSNNAGRKTSCLQGSLSQTCRLVATKTLKPASVKRSKRIRWDWLTSLSLSSTRNATSKLKVWVQRSRSQPWSNFGKHRWAERKYCTSFSPKRSALT